MRSIRLATALACVMTLPTAPPLCAGEGAPGVGKPKKGLLRVVSGTDGKTLKRIKGLQRGDEFGAVLGADSLPDLFQVSAYLIGAPGANGSAGRLWAVDVAGRPTYYHVDGSSLAGGPLGRFGAALLDLGHIGGDTPVHWAVGAPGSGAGGVESAVVILHEQDSRLGERLRITAAPEARLGFAITVAENDRRDSIIDHFVASAPGQANGGKGAAGALHRISALDGSLVWTVLGKNRNQHLGYSLGITPDEDGDDVWEIVAGGPGNRKRAGQVLVISGGSGQTLRKIDAPTGAGLFGFATARLDADGDGVGDLIVGAPATDCDAGPECGAVYAFSGVDHAPLWTLAGETPGQWLGASVGSAGDADDDGIDELAVGSLYREPERPKKTERGGVRMVSGADGSTLWEIQGKKALDRLGWTILGRTADGDGDGVLDLLIQVPRGDAPFVPE